MPKKVELTIGTTWSGAGPYTQTVTTSDYTVTSNTMVDLIPDSTLVDQLVEDGVEKLYISNDNAVLTAVAVGAQPSAEITVTAVLSEVN